MKAAPENSQVNDLDVERNIKKGDIYSVNITESTEDRKNLMAKTRPCVVLRSDPYITTVVPCKTRRENTKVIKNAYTSLMIVPGTESLACINQIETVSTCDLGNYYGTLKRGKMKSIERMIIEYYDLDVAGVEDNLHQLIETKRENTQLRFQIEELKKNAEESLRLNIKIEDENVIPNVEPSKIKKYGKRSIDSTYMLPSDCKSWPAEVAKEFLDCASQFSSKEIGEMYNISLGSVSNVKKICREILNLDRILKENNKFASN